MFSNVSEYQILKTKLIVIEHIKSNALNHPSPSTWTKILTDVNHPNSILGPNYVKNLQHFFQENSIPIIDKEKLKSITSFAKGAWMKSSDCDNVESSLFSN